MWIFSITYIVTLEKRIPWGTPSCYSRDNYSYLLKVFGMFMAFDEQRTGYSERTARYYYQLMFDRARGFSEAECKRFYDVYDE